MIELANITTESNKSVVEVYCDHEGLQALKTFVKYLKLKKEYETCLTDLKNILEDYDDI